MKDSIVTLILITGLPGTGKSFLARKLLKEFNPRPILLSTDIIRKQLFNISEHRYVPFGQDIYTEKSREYVYNILLSFAAILIQQSQSIILDGTFYSSSQREPLFSLCERTNTQLIIIKTTCKEETIKKRMVNRLNQEFETSDADFKVYLELKKRFEPFKLNYLSIDTEKDIETNVKEVMTYIEQLQT